MFNCLVGNVVRKIVLFGLEMVGEALRKFLYKNDEYACKTSLYGKLNISNTFYSFDFRQVFSGGRDT